MRILSFLVSSARRNENARRGFTLLEVIIAISILVILSGIMLSYSRNAVKSLALADEEAAMLNIMFHAKSLSETFRSAKPPGGEPVCSYGIQVDAAHGHVFVFRDLVPVGGNCDATANNQYADGDNPEEPLTGVSNNFYLDSDYDFKNTTDLEYVVFIPPDPEVIINNDPVNPSDPAQGTKKASIIVENKKDPSLKFTVEVNNFGQITVK